MAPRLVLIHGIGGPGQADLDRKRWISALAKGARDAGHSGAADRLEEGTLAEVTFAYYGHLFARTGEQGAGTEDLDEDEALLLTELLADMARALLDTQHEPSATTLKRVVTQLEPTGEAEGAGDLVRRAINAATAAGARSGDRPVSGRAGGLRVRDLAQVARYLTRGETDGHGCSIDPRIREVVSDALGLGPTSVVTHSLGSVVAFETLHEHVCSVPLWVTLGSPFAMRAVVWPKVQPRPPTTPDTVMRWLNFWNRDDIIAARPILESDVLASAVGVLPCSIRVDSDGLWVHSATKYLAKADVAGPVMEALGHLMISMNTTVPRHLLVIASQCENMNQLTRLREAASSLCDAFLDPSVGACQPGLPSSGALLCGQLPASDIEARVREAITYASRRGATLVLALLGHGFVPGTDSSTLYLMGWDSVEGVRRRSVDVGKLLTEAVDEPGVKGVIGIVDTCALAAALPPTSALVSGAQAGQTRLSLLMASGMHQSAYDMDLSCSLAKLLGTGMAEAGSLLHMAEVVIGLRAMAPAPAWPWTSFLCICNQPISISRSCAARHRRWKSTTTRWATWSLTQRQNDIPCLSRLAALRLRAMMDIRSPSSL